MNLFKVITVKSILIMIMATCFISSGNCFANKKTLTNEEREYIHKLIKEVEGIFGFFQQKIELFVDIRDRTPYRIFVGDLCSQLDLFVKDTVTPLKKRLEEGAEKDSPFYQGLVVVDELLTEFLDKLHKIRQVLFKYVSARKPEQALELAKELEPHINPLIATEVWNKLEAKLRQVETLMKQIEEHDILIKLAQLKKVLEVSKKGSSSLKIAPSTVVACIGKKMRNNK